LADHNQAIARTHFSVNRLGADIAEVLWFPGLRTVTPGQAGARPAS